MQKATNGKFEVVAGGRRLKALKLLASEQIVEFFSRHVENDTDFEAARVPLPPPFRRQVTSTAGPAEIGVIGMFRNDAATLAADLADFLHRIFRQGRAHTAAPRGHSH